LARPLTAQEQTLAQQAWPRMNAGAVIVTDEPTNRYNCLAWTLGITTSWIWPWPTANVRKAEFDTFYRSCGFVPSAAGPIGVFGLNMAAMTHGSVSGSGHGHRWESKCGAWLRIQHGLAEMEGGSLYGDVLGFYSRGALKTSNVAYVSMRLRTMKTAKLSKADMQFIRRRVEEADPALRERFERAYQAWKTAIAHPLIAISSDPATRTQTPAFLELISLGPATLPLLMEKLSHSDEFFALQATDRLIRPAFVVSRPPDDPAILLGEQGRAIETVKQWIRTEA
jgi:hypothetical protein